MGVGEANMGYDDDENQNKLQNLHIAPISQSTVQV
jgi:hypothetical protein